MSRLDDALKAHAKKLRDELAAARRRYDDLTTELAKLDTTIQDLQTDLTEVTTEIDRRDVGAQQARHFVIAEGFYD